MSTIRTRKQPRIWKQVGWSLFLTSCLCVGVRPAHAGHYWIAPQSQTGSVTETPVGSTAVTTSLDNTDGTYSSSGGFMGSISYSYSTTYRYSWIADYDGESPQADSVTLTGTSPIVLSTTSNAEEYDGSGSVSVTMLGTTHSYSGTSTSRYPDLHTESISETGSSNHSQTFSLTGDGGTFSVVVTASLNTGANGVFSGQLILSPSQLAGTTLEFKTPAPNATRAHNTNFPVVVEWYSPAAVLSTPTVRVRIEVKVAGSTMYVTKALQVQTNGLSGTANATISITTIGPAELKATLELVTPGSGIVFELGSATTSLTVN